MAGKILVTILFNLDKTTNATQIWYLSLATLVENECFQHTPCKGIQDSL